MLCWLCRVCRSDVVSIGCTFRSVCMSGSVEVCGVRDVRSRLRSTQRSGINLVTGHIDPDGGVKLGVKSGEDVMCSTYR